MPEAWARHLTRWTRAGLLDKDAAERIRAFELAHAGSNRLKWPLRIALAFGALTLGAGVLLFVSAHWDSLSPVGRFSLVGLPVSAKVLKAASPCSIKPWRSSPGACRGSVPAAGRGGAVG